MDFNATTIEDLVKELKKPGKAYLHPSTKNNIKFEVIKRDMIRELLDNWTPENWVYWVRINAETLYIFYIGA